MPRRRAGVGSVKLNAPASRAAKGMCILRCFSYYAKDVSAANSLDMVPRLPTFGCHRTSERGKNSSASRQVRLLWQHPPVYYSAVAGTSVFRQ